MMAMINNHGVVEAPTRDDIALWAVSAHWDMDGTLMMRKAWRKTRYSWFEEEDEPTVDPEQVHAEGGVFFSMRRSIVSIFVNSDLTLVENIIIRYTVL